VRVLAAVDDQPMSRMLAKELAAEGMTVDLAASGNTAISQASRIDYGVILLETAFPDCDGFEVCRTLRGQGITAPIVFVTARSTVADRVRALDIGGDDYLIKPIARSELLARLRAITRRGPIEYGVVLRVGDLRLDSVRRQAFRGEQSIALSPKEYAVLEALMREPGRVFSQFDLLERAWTYQYENRSNVVEVYIRYLREKIDRPFGRRSLQTVRGVGYRISADD
jgi:two-component system, OmpR family, response regulator